MATWRDWFVFHTHTDFPKPDGPELWSDWQEERVLPLSAELWSGGPRFFTDPGYQPKPISMCTYCGTPWREDGNGRCRSCGGYQAVAGAA